MPTRTPDLWHGLPGFSVDIDYLWHEGCHEVSTGRMGEVIKMRKNFHRGDGRLLGYSVSNCGDIDVLSECIRGTQTISQYHRINHISMTLANAASTRISLRSPVRSFPSPKFPYG